MVCSWVADAAGDVRWRYDVAVLMPAWPQCLANLSAYSSLPNTCPDTPPKANPLPHLTLPLNPVGPIALLL